MFSDLQRRAASKGVRPQEAAHIASNRKGVKQYFRGRHDAREEARQDLGEAYGTWLETSSAPSILHIQIRLPVRPETSGTQAGTMPTGAGNCGNRQGKNSPWLHETVKEIACSRTVQKAFMRMLPISAVQVREMVRAFGEVPPRRQAMRGLSAK